MDPRFNMLSWLNLDKRDAVYAQVVQKTVPECHNVTDGSPNYPDYWRVCGLRI